MMIKASSQPALRKIKYRYGIFGHDTEFITLNLVVKTIRYWQQPRRRSRHGRELSQYLVRREPNLGGESREGLLLLLSGGNDRYTESCFAR